MHRDPVAWGPGNCAVLSLGLIWQGLVFLYLATLCLWPPWGWRDTALVCDNPQPGVG